MKKIVFLLFLIVAACSSVFAVDKTTCSNAATPSAPNGCTKNYNCNNQPGAAVETQLSNGATITTSPATCGYGTDAQTTDKTNHVCSFIVHGGTYTDHSVTNCLASNASAPVNAGLIFLIIAGGGLGFFLLAKQQRSKMNVA